MPSSRRPKLPARIHANLTPLIDVTFLLIVFFILVAQITNSQIVDKITLPQPEDAVSIEPTSVEDSRLTLNILPFSTPNIPAANPASGYRLGSHDYPATAQGLNALTAALTAARQYDPEVIIDLRADKATPYARIFPVLNATSRAGITRINLLVQTSDESAANSTKINRNGG